jgi:uncharacterized protein (DUF302 family)
MAAKAPTDRNYGRMVELDMPFDEAIDATTAALREQGFGVLTTIEVDKVLKDKIGVDRDRYTILGACNPQLANTGLEADIDLGLLLPCNVVVREERDRRYVTFVDPDAMLAAAGESPELTALATEAKQKLDAAADTLAHR